MWLNRTNYAIKGSPSTIFNATLRKWYKTNWFTTETRTMITRKKNGQCAHRCIVHSAQCAPTFQLLEELVAIREIQQLQILIESHDSLFFLSPSRSKRCIRVHVHGPFWFMDATTKDVTVNYRQYSVCAHCPLSIAPSFCIDGGSLFHSVFFYCFCFCFILVFQDHSRIPDLQIIFRATTIYIRDIATKMN